MNVPAMLLVQAAGRRRRFSLGWGVILHRLPGGDGPSHQVLKLHSLHRVDCPVTPTDLGRGIVPRFCQQGRDGGLRRRLAERRALGLSGVRIGQPVEPLLHLA